MKLERKIIFSYIDFISVIKNITWSVPVLGLDGLNMQQFEI
jgi:hypothetical protein